MAIKLYQPKTKAFVSFTAPEADLPLSELLLLNMLIEMQVQTEILAAFNQKTETPQAFNQNADTPQQLRTDVAAEI